jgi:response regulator NasT
MNAAATPATTSPLRVLVADDDASTCILLADQLTACGHQVVAAASTGADAVARAAALLPDVVVLDVHMPDGSGTDAAALILRGLPGTGIVLLTGDLDVMLSDAEVTGTGAVAVLPKPTPRALLDCTVRLASARAREIAAARTAASGARQQLEERKLIERAKGILMRRTGTTEQEAYRILQRSSQDKATPMVKLAQAVLTPAPAAPPRPRAARRRARARRPWCTPTRPTRGTP